MWLQMGEEGGAPLMYLHQVKHIWVGYADGWSGTSEEGAEAGEQQATAQVVMKRYGVLHPYPLPSLWRSSPGQIRNFPVDATAS